MASSRRPIKKQDLRLVGTLRLANLATLRRPAAAVPRISFSTDVASRSCLLHSGQDDETVVDVTEMADPDWDIRRDGRAWSGEEGLRRYALTPERFELIEGKLFSSDEERRVLLGLLLENLGADAAVRLGDPHVWLEAISHHAGWPIVDAVREETIPVGANELPHDAQIAAALLGRVMADLSEDYWCAGWMNDLEFDLWSAFGVGANVRRVAATTNHVIPAPARICGQVPARPPRDL